MIEGGTSGADPGLFLPGLSITHKTCRSALNPSRIPGADYCLNPYTGCSHGCLYCYAACRKGSSNDSRRWGTFVEVKTNFPARLSRELARARPGSVLLATITDAYQPVEQKYGLTRTCLELLADSNLRITILTKSDLVVRDLEILRQFKGVSVGFSLTVADDSLARLLEPGAPPTSCRLRALSCLSRHGIRTWVFIAPVIPGLGDTPENLSRLVEQARAAGAAEIDYDPLNPYPSAVANLEALFRRYFPRRIEAFRAAVKDRTAYRRHLAQLWKRLWG
ncbi:MAG: SPL family radical SAM protein [Moorellales bacterium]